METRYYKMDKLLVFKINEEIDECSVKEIRRKADYEIERFMPREVIFDFNCVTFMDSAGIGMVIGRYKETNMLGGKMELANLTESVKKIFAMSGVLKIIPEVDLEEKLKKTISKENKREVVNL
ncbi:MAG: anti-sigma factor antagonist [Clostridia bacterium]|nr:anti-sigma factor antagonist [Clostridia bacterium]